MRRRYLAIFLLLITACASGDRGRNDSANNSAADHKMMDHSTHGAMDHSTMTTSPGAEKAQIDLQFIDTMIVHHQGAIDMAKLAETRAEHTELRKLASDIIREQEREIATMNEMRQKWFGGTAQAVNMEFPGMSVGMRGMDMKKLGSLRGNEFDVEFIRQMIPHHEGAVEMAKHIRSHDAHAELKQLGDDIIKAQDAEIKQMREWHSEWQKAR